MAVHQLQKNSCSSHLLERISSHEELAQGQYVSVVVLGRSIVHLNKQDWRRLALGANDVVHDLHDECAACAIWEASWPNM